MVLAALRDIAIIVLAAESIALGILLFILIFQVYRLIQFLDREIRPIVESAKKTSQLMEGTASVIGEAIARPAIEVASFLKAAKHVVKILLGRRRQNV